MKTTTRKSFPIYHTWMRNVEKLTTEEKALLLDMLFDFYYKGEGIDIPAEMVRLDMFWDSITPFIIENEEKYQSTSSKRSENMSKARQSNPKLQPTENTNTRQAGINIPTKQVSNDNDNVNDNGNGDENENENGNVNNNDKPKEWFKGEINKGVSVGKLQQLYPHSSSLLEAISEHFNR